MPAPLPAITRPRGTAELRRASQALIDTYEAFLDVRHEQQGSGWTAEVSRAHDDHQQAKMAVRHTLSLMDLAEREGRYLRCPCSSCLRFCDGASREEAAAHRAQRESDRRAGVIR